TGIDVWGAERDSALQIVGNTITCIETEGGPMYGWGTGVEIDDSENVVVDGNVITNAQYGIYTDDVYNLTISNNQITGCGNGIDLYDAWMCWIESNTVKNNGDGLYVDSYCENIIIGNNTFADNAGDGVYVYYYYTYDITLYNNEFSGNGCHGLYAQAYDSGLMWYVDADSVVARNDVYFEGQIEIMEGGTMMVEDVDSFVIYGALIQVDEGGLLFMSNSDLEGWGYLEVHGTFWANECLFTGFDIYLGPTSAAEIRASAIMFYEYAGIHVDGCSPVIADNLLFSPYGIYGILVEGEGASPSIISNIIAMNEQGVYARDTDMGGIYDNIFLLNTKSGILAENATGNIHDNVFLVNKIEILLRNCDVSIEDNEIGYTDLSQVLANYAPLLGHFMSTSGEEAEATSSDPWMILEMILDITDLDLFDLTTWVKGHNGIWAENSVVETSGNVYGMFNYALYAVGSEIHFADDITMQELVVPHATDGATVNYSVNIYVLNGIYASGSTLWVDGSTIDVLDDAIVLENSQAWIEGANLMAGDFDYFLFAGSDAYNINTTYGKYKVEDTSMLYEGTWLTLHAEDNDEPAANVTIVVKNAKGEIVFEGVTDENGMVRMLLPQYALTSSGKDDSFSPYTANATFESGEKSMDLGLNESYMDATISGEKKSDMGAILAVIGVLVIILLIVAAVVVMRRRK
ncbi:MAG: right-handed parallel beta-helix repeat-containing protein, partial [Methanomassiliicoccales archaeon]|nr:right-handed parallel beta-helix repeat-containing protein [Methanomassiliicoccales archaeon]